MKSKKLLSAAVAAITMLAGGLGMALWPSSGAGAQLGGVRKFTGLIRATSTPLVSVHNPTAKPLTATVISRAPNGAILSSNTLTSIPANAAAETWTVCNANCTLEVFMPNALLQPSAVYYAGGYGQHWLHVHSGDFSR